MLDKEKMLSHLYREEDLLLGGYIIDKIDIVLKRKSKETSHFLNPYQREIATPLIKQMVEVNYIIDGAYKEAERKRITIFPEYLFPDHVETEVCILKIEGNFKFQPLTHRDFLGAILGLGLKREMIGDILILNDYTQVVVATEIKDFLLLKLEKVHQIPVKVKEISSEDLVIPYQSSKEVLATVASMRLDAVASAGFGDSRSKIARAIKNEKVKLNFKPENNPSQEVKIDDLISIRNKGRVKVVANNGLSHRGRIKLKLQKFT